MVANKRKNERNTRVWVAALAIPAIVVSASLAALTIGATVTEAIEVDKPLVIGVATTSDSIVQSDAAQPDAKDAEAKPAKPAVAPTVGSPEERSATALAFVREHHPELVDLLERLKAKNVTEHERAIRELARTSDRLAGLRDKNPERYALELDSWKIKSQIQLLSARASLAPNEDLTSELRALIERQLELRVAQLELERSELAERLDRVEVALESATVNQQTQLDKQLNDALRGIDVARQREADRRAKKSESAGGKTKRDNKKESKKTPKPDAKPKPDVKPEVKSDARPAVKSDAKKDSGK